MLTAGHTLIALHRLNSMLVWKAARATSAALSYFDPIEINGVEYRDGGLMYNNPVDQVASEASVVFPDRPQIIVSLGTGLASKKPFTGSLAAITKELADIATRAETVSRNFYQRDGSRAAKSGQYFRFNVPEIGDQGLAESKPKDLAYIRTMTEDYIDNPETGFKLTSCTEKLTEGALNTISFNPGLPEDLPCVSSTAPRTMSLEERWEELKR
jgi:predicted acylesterase/phospholipase RssA